MAVKVTLCRLPHYKLTGIGYPTYPLWAGYLSSAIGDMTQSREVALSFVDGEVIEFHRKSLIQKYQFLNRVINIVAPRLTIHAEKLRDFAFDPTIMEWTVFMDKIMSDKPDIIAVSIYTNELPEIRIFASLVKKINPGTIILVGGIHATVEYKKLGEHIPEIDYICIGEGEQTFREFIEARIKDSPFEDLPGIYNPLEPNRFKPRTLISDLDSITPPNRTLLDRNLYRSDFSIFSSRGCPFHCAFCSSHNIWTRKVRYHSVDRIMSEFVHIVEDLGGRRIIFVDDTFVLKKDRVLAVAKAIQERKYKNINIHVGARVDFLDKELIDALVKAGVRSMSFGIETGSERLQKQVNKNINGKIAAEIIEYAKKAGVNTLSYYMVGHPTETAEDVEESIALLKKTGTTRAIVCSVQPLPGTVYFDEAVKRGFDLNPETAFEMEYIGHSICNMSAMSDEELMTTSKKFFREANKQSLIGKILQAVDYFRLSG